MSSDFTVRPYREGDEHGILALFNAVFAEDNPSFTPRTLEHWNWQFRDNSRGHHTFVAEDASGTLIGNYTAIPALWLDRGAPMLGSQAVDTCVAKAWRRVLKKEGLFLTLARAFFDAYGQPDRDRIVYGFPNPQAFRIGTRILDYRPVHTPVVSLVRDFAQDWIDYLGPMGGDAVDVREVDAIPPDVDALFDASMASLPLVLRRDRAYLEWRYARCPTFRYRVLEARAGGRLRGVLVLRTEWFDKPLAPLVDWIVDGADREAVAGLARRAATLARDAGKTRIETWAPGWSSLANTLRTIGFAPDPSTFNLCIRVFGPDFDESWAKDHWFFTMGDSDIY